MFPKKRSYSLNLLCANQLLASAVNDSEKLRGHSAAIGQSFCSAPVLEPRPQLGELAELRTAANEDRDVFLQRVRIVGTEADILHVLEQLLQGFTSVAQDDEAVARVSPRSPYPPSLVST